MSNGKRDGLLPGPQKPNGVPETYLACARWLLQNPEVLEVWCLESNLPEIGTAEIAVTLDAGTWFLCRVNLAPLADSESIISFVPQYSRQEENNAT